MTQQQRWTRWLAALLPHPVAAAPERVLINLLCVLIGLTVLVSEPSGRLWSPAFSYAWALAMIFGGVAAVVGYWSTAERAARDERPRAWANSIERVGYLALLLATLPYGLRLVMVLGWPVGVIFGGIFLAIAGAKAVRLVISSAARDEVLRTDPTLGVDR